MSCVAGIGAVGAVGGAAAAGGVVQHKRGASWRYVIDAQLIDAATGVRMDMTGWTVKSQLRAWPSGRLIADFDCVLTDPVAQIFTHTATETAHWTEGRAQFDVVYQAPAGDVVSTNSVQVQVVPAVTQG